MGLIESYDARTGAALLDTDVFVLTDPAGATTYKITFAELKNAFQAVDATITALAAYDTDGILVQTATDTFTGRTITGTANQVTVADGDGISGNPTLSLPQSIDTAATVQFGTLTLDNTGLHLFDTDASHDLIIKPGSDLSADRTLTLTTGDADRTVTLSANLTVEATSLINQDVTTDATPTFAGADLSSGTATLGTVSGTIDAGGATSLELPNSATPTVNADGEIAVDTTVTDFSMGLIRYYSGEEMVVVALPTAEISSPSDGHVVKYDATNDEFVLGSVSVTAAPVGAQYVTLATDATLTGERVLTGTSNRITITDAGAGSTVTISTPQDLHSAATLQFGKLTLDNDGLKLLDTDASHVLVLSPGSNLTANRTLTITTGDANRTLTLSANLTVESAATVNQDTTTDATPTFAGANVSTGTLTVATMAGSIDMGSATSLEIPNSAAPTLSTEGHIALDTTVTDYADGALKYYAGSTEYQVIAVPSSGLTSPTNGYAITYNATSDQFELVSAAGGSGNTLDAAYDQGGAGAGRTITTDTGALQLTATALGGDDMLDIDHTASGTLTANTTIMVDVHGSRTHTGATTVTDDYDVASFTRTSISNNASANLTADGSVVRIENIATQTSGTLTDNVVLLEMVHDSTGTGAAVDIRQTSESNARFQVSGTGEMKWGDGSSAVDVQLSRTAANTLTLASGDTLSAENITVTSQFTAPNGAAPTVNAAGEIAVDTTIASYDPAIIFHDGTNSQQVISLRPADMTTTDNHVIVYDSGTSRFKMEAQAGGSSLWTDGGTTTYLTSTTDDLAVGATDNTGAVFVDVSDGITYFTAQNDTASEEVARFRGPNRATSANGDDAYITFWLEDSGGGYTDYAQILWEATSDDSSDPDGTLKISVQRSLSQVDYLRMNDGHTYIKAEGEPVDGDISADECVFWQLSGDTNSIRVKSKNSTTVVDGSITEQWESFEAIAYGTTVTTGDGKYYWRVPKYLSGMNLTHCAAAVGGAKSAASGPITVQIARMRAATAGAASRTAADILTTLLTIDDTEWDSKDAATPAVIGATNDDMNEGDILRIDVDDAGDGAAQGLFITLGFGS